MNFEVISLELDTFIQDGNAALDRALFSPKKLVAIHTGVMLAVSLVSALISLALGSVETAGGLSGMGTQAILSTADTILQLAQLVATPFWAAGLTFAALNWVRNQEAAPPSLLEGFRRFKPVLSSWLMLGMRYMGFGILAALISANLILFTPLAEPIYRLGTEAEAAGADIAALPGDIIPFAIGFGVIFLVIFALFALPFYYRYRMTTWLVMDKPGTGGMQAMFVSQLMTRRRRMEMFKLDLRFWWYYLLQVIAAGVGIAGIFLPQNWAYWLCLAGSYALQLAVSVWGRPRLEAAWGQCYEYMLHNAPPEPPKPQPIAPTDLPWNGWGPTRQE